MITDAKRGTALIGRLTFLLVVISVLGAAQFAAGNPSPKVLILPFHVGPAYQKKDLQDFANHVRERLRSAIGLLGDQVRVEGEGVTRDMLADREAPATDKDAVDLATRSGADLVIFGSLSEEDSQYRMRGVMWDLREGRVSVSTDLKVANIHGLPGVLQIFVTNINRRIHGGPRLPLYKAGPPAATGSPHSRRMHSLASLPRDDRPWRSPEIPTALTALDIGDIDGDRKNETVFLDDHGVTISRFEEGSLRTLAQFSQPPAAYLSAEVEDVDGDGIAELLLCYQTPEGLESAIVRYVNRNLKVSGKFPGTILRTIPDPFNEKKRILVGQRTDREDAFDGEMVRFRVNEGKVEPGERIMLPPGTLLLSYAAGRLGKDSSFLRIILNQDQRLMVFDRQNRLLNTVADRIYGISRSVRIRNARGPKKITIPGRLLITDTIGDGENELLVTKQSPGGSVIQALVWDGNQLKVKWKTVQSPGVVSDFRIRDFKNGGTRSLVLLLIKSNPFLALTGRAHSVVFAYDLLQP
jgi:hypothetical protein